ncbi:hypothetical protein [Marinomonas aquiplantarum]|uniref:Uncharacterized protein n=1 Tax=Marinomonas aquiplantarum TaxID=491951 RepID=A0A366D1L3_9GAMM|nr:hypothetical protein [Marinomonas aquiplantarum]RBO83967.1 hypothetical protein DFP76_103241 [Marinomonas aquiplantarum]
MSELSFKPNCDDVVSPDFRPYMIETAADYFFVAQNHARVKGFIQTSLSALSLEIMLKSFNAEVSTNAGKINETYKPNKRVKDLKGKAHDLVCLYELIDPVFQSYLFSHSDIDTLTEHRSVFTSERYGYEHEAQGVHTDRLVKLAGTTLCKIIFLYKKFGCKDPFIAHFDVNETYFNYVQHILIFQPSS